MHGPTRGVAHDRPDLVRRGERCWIDGDLIRLSNWPIGGIRPNGRRAPIPWLMDLSVLEEAMREVYGGHFRLGDRAPLLQAAANALASGDRRRAARIADAVAFPPPEYASRLHNAGARYLNWGPAHRRGNPPIDVEAWLDRLAWERKFDPDQPRVPRGHPDGGQWTGGAAGDAPRVSDRDEPITPEEFARAKSIVADLDGLFRRLAPNEMGPLHLVAGSGPKDPLEPFDTPQPGPRYDLPPLTEEEATGYLTPGVSVIPPSIQDPRTKGELDKWLIRIVGRWFLRAAKTGAWGVFASILLQEGFPNVVSYFDPPRSLEELNPTVRVEDYASFDDFAEKNPAGPGYEWHHIRERSLGSDQGWDVDTTENIARVPVIHHHRITALYASKPWGPSGPTVREWLRTMDPAFQWRFGQYVLRRQGVMQ
ncbi:MAG: hypothetical protein EXQ95_07890 [Alphaproteobacteria bacterium]|nr:hypothetical protein [Alphaproteobacteria bacterium]